MAKGSILTKIIYATTNLSNQASYVTVTMGTSAATGDQVIADVGLLLVMPTATNVSVQVQNAGSWTAIVAASTTNAVLIPSDGLNMRFHSADTSTTRTANYFVVQ